MAGEQSASNVIVAIKRESSPGVAAGATGAERMRIFDSDGLRLETTPVESSEKRADGNKEGSRHGSRIVPGGYNHPLVPGGFMDILLEAIMRSTWAAEITTTEADLTSLAIASNVLTAGSGSLITEGFRVGQVIYLTGMTETENNNRNLLITAVTASTMTVATTDGVALTDESADTTFEIVRRGNVVNAAAPVKYHHTIEQRDVDHNRSEQFLGVKLVGLSLTLAPNSPVTVASTWMGLNRVLLDTGESPYFTTPALVTGRVKVGEEILLRANGATVAKATSLTLGWGITAAGQPVLGSRLSPDIFDNDLALTGQVSKIRESHDFLTLYDGETEFEVATVLEERTAAAPYPCIGLFFPIVKLMSGGAPVGGGDGPKIETFDMDFHTKPAGVTGYDATIASISSSGVAA